MFQRFPLFQRLISWTKPYAPVPKKTREYEWFDWNSLLAEEPGSRSTVAEFMDGTSYFPSRAEMEAGIAAFVEREGVTVKYGCRWESTRATKDGFILTTSAGEYECKVAVFAVGVTQAWKPDIPGLGDVPHYVDTKPREAYRGRSVFILGKRNSGLEVANALLPVASQITLASPRPAKLSVLEHSTAGSRARYLQPYEDHVFGGGHLLLDAAIERIERHNDGFTIHAEGTTRPGRMVLHAQEAIATSGFTTPLQDLPALGVDTFHQGRLPVLTPYWESASAQGIYFAGSTTQAQAGLRKYGSTGNSAAVHGFRYNARILAHHIAEKHFGVKVSRPKIKREELVKYLLAELSHAPELWNQQSYLARVLALGETGASVQFADEGIQPLAPFVDSTGPDAVAVTVETDDTGDIHPAVYLRNTGGVREHLLPTEPRYNFESAEHGRILAGLLKPWLP